MPNDKETDEKKSIYPAILYNKKVFGDPKETSQLEISKADEKCESEPAKNVTTSFGIHLDLSKSLPKEILTDYGGREDGQHSFHEGFDGPKFPEITADLTPVLHDQEDPILSASDIFIQNNTKPFELGDKNAENRLITDLNELDKEGSFKNPEAYFFRLVKVLIKRKC